MMIAVPSEKAKSRAKRFRAVLIVLILLTWSLSWGLIPAQTANPFESGTEGERQLVPGQRATPETTGPIITDTTIPQSLGTATLFIPTFFSFTRGNFSHSWRRASAGGDFQSLDTSAQLFFGVAPRTEVYLVIPYLHNWAANVNMPGPLGQRNADFGGLGDVSITGKYLLIDEQPCFPAVAAIFTTSFPTAHHRHLNPRFLGTDRLGRGPYGFTPGLNFFKYAKPFLLYGNLWYSMLSVATVDKTRNYSPDRVSLNLAMEYPLIRNRWIFLCEFVSFYDAGRLIGHSANQSPVTLISILPALEFIATDAWSFDAGVLLDLLGKNTSYNITPNFSVFYSF
jgi:hypothetical protein